MLLHPGLSIFEESLNILADDDRATGLYLYGSIPRSLAAGGGSSGGGSRNELFVDIDFELRTKK